MTGPLPEYSGAAKLLNSEEATATLSGCPGTGFWYQNVVTDSGYENQVSESGAKIWYKNLVPDSVSKYGTRFQLLVPESGTNILNQNLVPDSGTRFRHQMFWAQESGTRILVWGRFEGRAKHGPKMLV